MTAHCDHRIFNWVEAAFQYGDLKIWQCLGCEQTFTVVQDDGGYDTIPVDRYRLAYWSARDRAARLAL